MASKRNDQSQTGGGIVATVVQNKDLRIERMALGPYGTNSYIVVCQKTGESLVVDAPADASEIIKNLRETRPRYILLTHDHFDHTGALAELRSQLKVPLATHQENAFRLNPPPEIVLNHGDTFSLGNLLIEVLHTPGHTPGSLCFKIGKILLAGDTLFPGGPGRTNSPGRFPTNPGFDYRKDFPIARRYGSLSRSWPGNYRPGSQGRICGFCLPAPPARPLRRCPLAVLW